MKRFSVLCAALAAAVYPQVIYAQTADTNAVPTFAHDIAPIIYQNCSACHRPGEAAPFSLLTYQDVKKHARQIAAVTQSRYMPPWPPEERRGRYGQFQDERRLNDEQIRLIADWVRAGAPEGDASKVPPAPHFSAGWQLGPPDLVLKAAYPYTMPSGGPDVFWNFVFQPDVKATRYVRAVEIRPGGAVGTRNIHHANLLVDRMGSVRRLGNGFPGMDFTINENPFDPAGHFLFWKPGTVPYSEPDGMAWRLDPGNLLVLNTHMQPSGKPEQVAPAIGLYFTDKSPTRFPILIELEHDGALNIPPGARDFVVSDDLRLPVDADVLAVYPHAHYLGKLLEAYATLPDGSRESLIRIPDWDLNWQAVYRYKQPVFLPKGTVISMRYHYDNSAANPRNPNRPPKRVCGGNQATDEMAHLWLQVLPRGAGDHRRAIQEAMMRHRLDKYPNDFSAHLNLGAILLSRLDRQGAVTELQEAVRIEPRRPEAHDMLGAALTGLGFFQEGMNQFRLALAADPDYVNARYDFANALARSGKLDAAVDNFRQVVAAFPNSARMHAQFGVLLARAGKSAQALAEFDKALALDPADEEVRKARDLLAHQMAGR